MIKSKFAKKYNCIVYLNTYNIEALNKGAYGNLLPKKDNMDVRLCEED